MFVGKVCNRIAKKPSNSLEIELPVKMIRECRSRRFVTVQHVEIMMD